MKRQTTLPAVAAVDRALGLDPRRRIRADATAEELADAKEESDMAAHLNEIVSDYERSQDGPSAEELAAEYRARAASRGLGEVDDEVFTTHGISLREASVAARQAGRMDPTDPPGIEANMWATTGGTKGVSPASMGSAAETQTVTCPNCRHEFTVAAVHNVAHEAAVMDAGTLTSMLDSLLELECNLYGPLAGKKIISAADQREAVAAVAKMLNDHITHLDQVQTKYTGGKDDAEIRQAAAVTDYLQRSGYVGEAIPLSEYGG